MRTRVAFVGGAGRSGSTLLSLLLAQSPDGFAAGEITHLWERGVLNDELCGCGAPFSRCEFWQEVVRDAFGRFTRKEAQEVEFNRRRCCELWTLPQWLWPTVATSRLTKSASFYEPYLVQLYRSIKRVSGRSVVIDSSKFPPESLLAERSADIDLSLVHVVRNCKAVVFAWRKKKRRPGVHWEADYFRVYNPLVTCSAWLIFNQIFEAQRERLDVSAQVRYEDMVTSANQILPSVYRSLKLTEPDSPGVLENRLLSASNHLVSGNPMRFEKGPLVLQLDQQWESSLRWRHGLLVDLLAGRAQQKYGYR